MPYQSGFNLISESLTIFFTLVPGVINLIFFESLSIPDMIGKKSNQELADPGRGDYYPDFGRPVCFDGQRILWQVELQTSWWRLSRFSAHRIRGTTASQSCFPSSVKKYSTRGGISENTTLWINPSFWSSFNRSVSDLGLIPSRTLMISLNRNLSWCPRMLIRRIAHFFDIVVIIPSRGHKQIGLLSFSIVTLKL
jgi:hypothetical protein